MSVSRTHPLCILSFRPCLSRPACLPPLVYLVLRASEADWEVSSNLIFRERNLILLTNTIKLTLGVLLTTSLIAGPLAWLTVRTDIPSQKMDYLNIQLCPWRSLDTALAHALPRNGRRQRNILSLIRRLKSPRLKSGY